MQSHARSRHPLLRQSKLASALTATIVGGLTLLTASTQGNEAPNPAVTSSATPAIPMPVIRRLTRVEYANSLRDLFGIEIPFTAELPADGQAAGFDNIGDALSLSPILLETYLKVARKTSELIIGMGDVSPVTEQFPATDSQPEWQEGMPLGTRGGVRVEYYFPRNAEYELRAFLEPGLILMNGERTRFLASAPEGVRFFRTRVPVPAGPHTFIATFPDEYGKHEGSIPNIDGPGGRPMGGPADVRGSAIRPTLQFWLDGRIIQSFEIQGPSITEAPLEVQPGPPSVARAEISGPFNPSPFTDTAARRRLMVCAPKRPAQESACAARILTPIVRRAYRREVRAADMAPVLQAFDRKRQTAGFDEAIGMGLRTILVSPDFLFRIELDPADVQAGGTYRVSDYELATRLSYFLWSSLPDEALLEEARRGRLRDRAALERQVRRMLSDPRADALVDNFAFQWLGLRDLAQTRPDTRIFPEFDEGLARAIETETRLFLRSVVRENRSVLEVISSNDAFLNERLAQLYGIDGVYGPAFRRVQLAGIEQRGGVISQTSVLMTTSHSTETSPILRGKWVLANLMNSPPQPPPPGVPPLDTQPAADGRKLTTRQQIERHQQSPLCNVCHSKMDPYGMALENYDAIGRWRTEENGSPIDSSAALPRGATFSGPAGLKQVLLARTEEFVAATVSRLMTYALGRELEKSDAPAVQDIALAAKQSRYRFADLVIGIVNSTPFQMRQARGNKTQE